MRASFPQNGWWDCKTPVHDKQRRSSASGEESTQAVPSNTWMASHLILSERPGQVRGGKNEQRCAVAVVICVERMCLAAEAEADTDTAACGALTGRLTVPSWPLVTPVTNNSPQTHWTNVDCVRRTTGETLLAFWDATVNLYSLSCVILTSWPHSLSETKRPDKKTDLPDKRVSFAACCCHLVVYWWQQLSLQDEWSMTAEMQHTVAMIIH